MMYNACLGTNIRSHLLDVGAETLKDLTYYNLTDNDRIMVMAKHIKDMNLVMGIKTCDVEAREIAKTVYERNKGLSYKYFPNIVRSEYEENSSYLYNVEITGVRVITADKWETIDENFSLNIKSKRYIDGNDIKKIIEFFSKRPYKRETFIKQVYETLKYLYTPYELKLN